MNKAKSRRPAPVDVTAFIRQNLSLKAVPMLDGIVLYSAHAGSGMGRFTEAQSEDPPAPYWAYAWAGGLALAHYFLEHPEAVAGRRVLDLGAGSGLVGIAAMKAGAAKVIAAESDGNGIGAIGLNAEANRVEIEALHADMLAGAPPVVDLIAAGDVFYDGAVAQRVTPFLERALAAGIAVLVGDPYRRDLPLGRLKLLAEYQVPDVGDAKRQVPSGVFALRELALAHPAAGI